MAGRINPDTGEYEDFGMGNQPDSFTAADTQNQNQGQSQGGSAYSDSDIEQRLRDEARKSGVTYSDSDLQDVRHRDNSQDALDMELRKYQQRATNDPREGQSGGVSGAYQGYLGGNQGGGGQLGDLLGYLKDRQTKEDAQRQAMRDILMKQIDANSQPVDVNDPQIHAQVVTQQLARQRAAERQRSQIAANLAGAHLGSSGAADTGMNAIEQQRGEGEAHDVAQTMGGELQQRRGMLQNLLNMAVQSGDNESAQTLQAQLHGIDSQLNDQHFQSDLGFRQSSFLDDLGFRLMAMQLGANQNAASQFL